MMPSLSICSVGEGAGRDARGPSFTVHHHHVTVSRVSMTNRESLDASAIHGELLIRRSWVRSPAGSYSYATPRVMGVGKGAGRVS